MPTQKPDLSEVSQSQLSELTGFSRETIRRRLAGRKPSRQDGRTLFYDPTEVLRVIYGAEKSGEVVDWKDRLAKAQAEGQELKNKKARGESIPASENAETLIGLATLVATRLQGVGPKVAPLAHAAETTAEAEEIITEEVLSSLAELAELATGLEGEDQELSLSSSG